MKKSNIFTISALLFVSVLSLIVNIREAKASETDKSYIVVFKDDVNDVEGLVDSTVLKHGVFKGNVYKSTIKGFSTHLSNSKVSKLKTDKSVLFVSEDKDVSIFRSTSVAAAQITPTGVLRTSANLNINKGNGIGVAVIDTGINLTHPDLATNTIAGKNCINSGKPPNDDNGHGSHVAGTIAALDNGVGVVGVAPSAKVIAVKVLNAAGSGTWSSVICGIDWVTANAGRYNIKVANMSLGGSGLSDNNCGNSNSDALHKAICKSTQAGVTYVVAAGNSASNASTFVPASYDDSVITVSALADSDGAVGGVGPTTSYGGDDTFASFSNYGSVVDLGAPGVSIYSTWKNGNYNTISGTSMASPHVAGSAALYLKTNPLSSFLQVKNGLILGGEVSGSGHTDPSGLHPEPVVNASVL